MAFTSAVKRACQVFREARLDADKLEGAHDTYKRDRALAKRFKKLTSQLDAFGDDLRKVLFDRDNKPTFHIVESADAHKQLIVLLKDMETLMSLYVVQLEASLPNTSAQTSDKVAEAAQPRQPAIFLE
jgi:hypothetical protein